MLPVPLSSKHVNGAKLFADRIDLIRGLEWPLHAQIAEIGVGLGDFSAHLIDIIRPSCFVGFDVFELHKLPELWGRPTADIFKGLTHLEFYKGRLAQFRNEIELVMELGDSSQRLESFPDRYFDLIYIDGDHTYEGVLRDAQASLKKIKNDGVLIFNDYIMFDHIAKCDYGVVPVVNDLCVNKGWRVIGFALAQQMFCDIAIQKI